MSTEPWLWRPRHEPEQPGNVVHIPYAGGSAGSLRPATRPLPQGYGYLGVELPGRGSRFDEDPVADIATAADEVTEALLALGDRPIVLFGHSLGALIGYEVTLRLQDLGRPPQALIASGNRAPCDELGRPVLAQLGDRDFQERIRDLALVKPELLADADAAEVLLPVLRADLELCERYPWGRTGQIRVPMVVLGGADDHLVPPEALRRWARLSLDPVTFAELPGGHMFVHDTPSPLPPLLHRICAGQPATT